ncbi:MAG: hypothetical protein LQ337_006112, partial [Flavoplaca oasis]
YKVGTLTTTSEFHLESVLTSSEADATTPDGKYDPLSLPLMDFTRDLNVNATSAFVAAQQAVLCFKILPATAFENVHLCWRDFDHHQHGTPLWIWV